MPDTPDDDSTDTTTTTTTATDPVLDSLRALVDRRVDARLAEHGLLNADDGSDGGDDDNDDPLGWGLGHYGSGSYGDIVA